MEKAAEKPEKIEYDAIIAEVAMKIMMPYVCKFIEEAIEHILENSPEIKKILEEIGETNQG